MSSEDYSRQNSHAQSADQDVAPKTIAESAGLVRTALNGRSVVFVGIMGVGKSTIGWRVAKLLDIPFVDADSEIELASDLTIAEIFEKFGEAYFRAGERKVIERLLKERNQVLATGGGAFMDDATRKAIAENAVSIWLDADIELIMQRVLRRKTRPLLKQPNPRGIIEDLLEKRNPVYAMADYKFCSHDVSRDIIAAEIVTMLGEKLANTNLTENTNHG